MNEPVGAVDSNNRTNNLSERNSWYHLAALAFFLGSIYGIILKKFMDNSYYAGLREGLSILPETEVNHE